MGVYLFLWKEQALGSMPLSVFYPYLKHMQMVSSRGQVSINLSGDIHAESVHCTSMSQMRMVSRAGNKKAAMMKRERGTAWMMRMMSLTKTTRTRTTRVAEAVA